MGLEAEETTTDNIECPADASIDNLTAFTWGIAIFTADTAPATRWETICKGFNLKHFKIETTKKPQFIVVRAGDDAIAIGDTDYVVGAWMYYYCTYDETDGPRIFIGTDEADSVVESGYSSRTVGTLGTTNDSTAAFRMLNHDQVGFNRGFDGIFARGFVEAKRLTLAEIIERHNAMHTVHDDTRLIWDSEEVDGDGNLVDLSGNGNTGVPTGLTRVADYPTLPGAAAAEEASSSFVSADGGRWTWR